MNTGAPITTVPVELARPYNVHIGPGALASLGERLQQLGTKASTKVLVVSNPVVAEHYAQTVSQSLQQAGFTTELLVIDAGEEQKTPATVALIHDAAYRMQLERGSLMVALGGGVVGDMTGFAAATWLRASLWCRCPPPCWPWWMPPSVAKPA